MLSKIVFALVPTLTSIVVAGGPAKDVPLPDPKPLKRVTLSEPRAARKAPAPKPYAKFDAAGHHTLPGAQRATVAVGTAAHVGPVTLAKPQRGAAPGRVTVATADQATAQAAGVHGLLFSVKSAAGAGTVGVQVDASEFRSAYGGSYASRLHLVQLPVCALTTPSRPECQTATPVPAAAQPLSAQVAVAASGETVLAATADASGPSGDYSATSLSPGGSWSVSGNTGAFTYSYPIAVPPPIAGVGPSVNLSYSSAAQDARTEGTNNQSSWLGDGWSAMDNFVERTYRSCTDVTGSGAPKGSADLCWGGEILTMSLNGQSTQIVYDDTTKTFHPAADNSTTKIDRLTGATNGTKNGEYFRVTENGIQYYFGLNRLPGWAAANDETKSAWTAQVYQAHDGVSACSDSSTFADTACTLGYRFNLDYVVDSNNNAMAYYYTPETGYYGANMKNTATSYVRDGYLRRIDYGLTASTVYAAAPEQVVFGTEERCTGDCTLSSAHPEFYPDVPVDLNCDATGDCTSHGPSFWSRRKLTSITTHVRVDGADKTVDRYDFGQTFPDNGDHAPTLFLETITHTGLDRLGGAGADASAGTVTFYPAQLPNRVGTLPGLPLMYYHRIGVVVTETGAETDISYSTPDCSSVPSDPSTNTTGCFPVFWTPEAQPAPLLDWFYTHPVSKVVTLDPHNNFQDGSQPKLVTSYAYLGKPGWHHDDNEVVKAKNRTWGQFRGYPEVDVTSGDTSIFHYTDGTKVYDQKSLTKSYYFLGMDKGNLTSIDGSVTVADDNVYAGQVFETDTFTSAGTIDHATITVPTSIGPTASRARTGLPALTAQMVRTAKTVNRQKVSSGWRTTEVDTFFNRTLGQRTTGMAVQADDRGEPGATGNVAHCTFTKYLDGPNQLEVAGEVITTDQDCTAAGANASGTLLSDLRTSYDGLAYGTAPTAGNPTRTQQATTATGVTPSAWVDLTTTTYDSSGRAVAAVRTPNAKMADGTTSLAQTVWTRRSPAAGALPSQFTTVVQVTPGVDCSAATVSSTDCQVSTQEMDEPRQLPVTGVSTAGQLSSMSYDALGRLTAVWQPNRSKAAGASANITYAYAVNRTGPTVVTTRTLLEDGTYNVSKTLSDALLRTLETQFTGENGVRLVSDTQYDSHGWTVLTNDAYATAGAPSDTLVSDQLSQVSIPRTTVTDHDAMGRATQVTTEHNGAEQWHTRTVYTGDTTTVVPPAGGVATTQTLNGRGQGTQLRQYTTAPALSGTITGGFTATGGGGYDTKYAYTALGQESTVTGPDNAVWSNGYDLRGRVTSHTDPDTGASLTAYDDAGNVTVTRDARGIQLGYTYDLLGRKLTAVDKSKSNFKFASWTYDTVQIGKLTSSSRYVSGVTGDYTVAVTGYTALGHALGETITLPTAEQPLPGSYTTDFAYSTTTELLARQTDPAIGGLAGETITYGHDQLGQPSTTSGIDQYVGSTSYTDFGQLSRVTAGPTANQAEALYSYEDDTLRLKGRQVYRSQGVGPLIDDVAYQYDDAGNTLSTVDKQSESGNVVTDTQCYRYDGLARLADAWTSSAACTATPAAISSTAGSYWQTFAYNAVGDRTSVVDHGIAGAADSSTTYTDGCSSGCNRTGAQPHTLTATTGGADPATFVYDVAGNLLTRTPATTAAQTLKWDDEGHLAEVTAAGATTKYLYDADGNQLIRRDPGRTALFAGDTEIVINTSVSPAVSLGAVRTYGHGGGGTAVAVRSTLPGGGTNYLFNDPHGTATLAMDTTSQQVARQQFKPYGEARAAAGTTAWPDMTRGYLGKSKDQATGYTDLGARKYDPSLGRFISADPVFEATDLSQLGGYAYAGDNPVTRSDPDGLRAKDPDLDDQFGRPKDQDNGCGSANACEHHQEQEQTNSGSSYVPITKHVTVQTSDPHYGRMNVAFAHAMSDIDPKHRNLSTSQEMAIWHMICVTGKYGSNVCPDSMKTALTNLIDGPGLSGIPPVEREFIDQGMVFAVGSAFAPEGGMGELMPMPPEPAHEWNSLYHYTDEDGMNGIVKSGEIRQSTGENARFGDGQYFSDVRPGSMPLYKMSELFFRTSKKADRITHYVEISVRSLDVQEPRPHTMVVLNSGNLNVRGLMIAAGGNGPPKMAPMEPTSRWPDVYGGEPLYGYGSAAGGGGAGGE
ncbi:HYD1 signature containing ADP-ribosyltransferase family protein [Actinoplanes sp. NPDC026619]|uniref:HYD1 signature containing ADP-ribosyltransferase family protein n=1 Tax=Actinoplanes sp. NPDC026619 TaxID=3155798 RepID=UPI0033E7924C